MNKRNRQCFEQVTCEETTQQNNNSEHLQSSNPPASKRQRMAKQLQVIAAAINVSNTKKQFCEQRVKLELESILNDLQRRVQTAKQNATQSAPWNARQHLLLALRLGRQYKREHVMFDSHILPFLVQYLRNEGLLNTPASTAASTSSSSAISELADYIELVNMQEKSDAILNKAYVCTMKQGADNLREAERLLLSILPDSVGGEVLDLWFEEDAFDNKKTTDTNLVQYFDVEQPLELAVLQEEKRKQQQERLPCKKYPSMPNHSPLCFTLVCILAY